MTAINSTYRIRARHITELAARVEAANKIAKKIGVDALTLEVGKETYENVLGVNGWYKVYYNDVTITGEYPQFDGWDFVTQLDHETGLVRSHGETNHRHLLGDTTCDHCNTNRQRNVTYVIKNEHGEEMRVGGSCLKYFIPTKSVNSLASFFEAVESFGDEFVGGGSAKPCYTTIELLTWVCMVVERDGRYIAGGETKFEAMRLLNANTKEARNDRDELLAKVDFDKMTERAETIRKWVGEQEATNDFMSNVIASCKPDYIEYKQAGFLAASVVAYSKGVEKEEIMKAKAKKVEELGESEYIGTVKKRETFTLTLEKVIVLDGYYGDTYIHRFRDEQNNLVVWFGSKRLENKADEYVAEGEKATVKATVKTHEEFKGEKQTLVQRVAFVA
ncbi:hypothetical protein VPHD480_0017 [Vibrio phage D480]